MRATEQSAGARGFNPEVEARHRSSRSDLATAYRLVDRIQERKLPEEKIAAFVREGKLGEALAERDAEPPVAPAARPVPPWKQTGGRR